MPKVEVVKLSDGALSVRLSGHEVHILPKREECTLDDLQIAFNKTVDALDLNEDQGW